MKDRIFEDCLEGTPMNRWTIPFFFCALFVSFRQCGLSQGDLLATLCVFKSVAVFKWLRVVGMKGCGTSPKCYVGKYFHKAIEVSKRKRPQTWDNFSETVLHLEIISSQCNGVHLQGWDWSPEGICQANRVLSGADPLPKVKGGYEALW